MNDPRYQDLIAKAAHDVEGTDESNVIVEKWEDRTILTTGGYELVIMKNDAAHPIRFSGVNVQTVANLLACQALLQEARRQMGGE